MRNTLKKISRVATTVQTEPPWIIAIALQPDAIDIRQQVTMPVYKIETLKPLPFRWVIPQLTNLPIINSIKDKAKLHFIIPEEMVPVLKTFYPRRNLFVYNCDGWSYPNIVYPHYCNNPLFNGWCYFTNANELIKHCLIEHIYLLDETSLSPKGMRDYKYLASHLFQDN